MIDVSHQWNPKQSLLKSIIHLPERFNEAMKLCLQMHAMIHASNMAGLSDVTYEDQLWKGLSEAALKAIPPTKSFTVAWHLWHITRIEDLTSNILLTDEMQVLHRDSWLHSLNVDITDTGNAMTLEEVKAFSEKINQDALRNYRIAVGRQTQKIIKSLKPEAMKQKIPRERLQRIGEEGGVLDNTKWLLDFWGRKNMAGILLMPITRHQVVHLNDALKMKVQLNRINHCPGA